MFLSLEGVDGVGKSTQLTLLAGWLAQQGHDVVRCRDPGSTPLGEALREIVLHGELAIAGRSEMLIYMAARAQLVEQVIRPALDAGRVVLSDRFLLSNVAYQGHAGGLDPQQLWDVGRVATGNLLPDLSVVLDMDVKLAATRIDRSPDRLEARGPEYMQRVRQGFLDEAHRHADGIQVVDASGPPDEVQAEIQSHVQHRWRTG